MSVPWAKAAPKVPQLYRTLCQNAECHAQLGGFHIPCAHGTIIYACGFCGTISEFRNEPYGIVPGIAGQMDPADLRSGSVKAAQSRYLRPR